MENFVPFEIAKKLKEKGFKEKCIAYYWESINEHTASFVVEDNMPDDGVCILDLISEHNKSEWSPFIDAPTISQVLKWLREEKGIHICISLGSYSDWDCEISKIDGNVYCNAYCGCHDYEQAALVGISFVIDELI